MLLAALVLATAAAAVPTFDTRRAAGFGDAQVPLRAYLTGRRRAGSQHFCVVGYRQPGGRQAWVHWREGRRLVLWEPTGAGREALRFSRRDLDLRRDVVAGEAALAGSSYRVTRAWVAGVLADCARAGTRYAVKG